MTSGLYSEELRQLASRAMQQAADMLSRLLRQQVRLEVSGPCRPASDAVAEIAGSPLLGVYIPVRGELNGGLLLTLTEEYAGRLSQHLLGMSECCDLQVEPASSTLKEIGNIIASAFLASIDSLLAVRALPEPPQLELAPADKLLENCRTIDSKPCLVLRTELMSGEDDDVRGAIYLFPTADSLDLLRARIAAVSLSEKSC